jgi:protein TonB
MLKRSWIDLAIVLLALSAVAGANASKQETEVSTASAWDHLAKKVVPTYPPLARTARIQGKVVLQVLIWKDGSVYDIRVKSGHPLLVRAALEAVQQWKYEPYTWRGKKVQGITTVVVTFSLGNAKPIQGRTKHQ